MVRIKILKDGGFSATEAVKKSLFTILFVEHECMKGNNTGKKKQEQWNCTGGKQEQNDKVYKETKKGKLKAKR